MTAQAISDQYAPGTAGVVTPGLTPAPSKPKARSWLEQWSAEYQQKIDGWVYADDFYTGNVVAPDNLRKYLVRRAGGESDTAYSERIRLADYTNHFALAADSLVGMLTAVEADANRTYGDEDNEGLGETDDRETPIGELWADADMDGNSYLTVWKRLATKLVVQLDAWVLIDSYDGHPKIRIIPATAVTQWVEDKEGCLTDVLVEEVVEARESIEDMAKRVKQWVRYRPEGWQRYRVDMEGKPVALVGDGNAGTYNYTDRLGRPSLPIFQAQLPLDRPVGYLMARKANAIFNQESARDHLIRTGNFPRLVYVGTTEAYDTVLNALEKGSSLLHESIEASGGSRFIAPPVANAQTATEVLKRKVEEFYVTFFREYGDAAAQKTATEVQHDVAAGVAAFLALLKAALDDAENNALWRIEQTVFPNDSSKWFVAHVERSDDFVPADPDNIVKRTAELVFGTDPVPVGVDAMVDAAKQIASARGLTINEDQIEQSVKAYALARALSEVPGMELPPEVKADLMLQMLGANGFVDEEQVTKMADGTSVKTLDLMRKALVAAAQAQADAKARQAEMFAMGSGMPAGGGSAPKPPPQSKVAPGDLKEPLGTVGAGGTR